MQTRLIEHGSAEYAQMLNLRVHALLEPIGVPPSYIEPEKEKSDFLIGYFERSEMIGCCILTPRDSGTVQLRQMAVRKDHQGQHIGKAVITFAEEVARTNGFRTVMMHARDPVIEFYKKCGYQIAGPQFFEVGIGHHKMQKAL
ncbi:MAG TPA: GNAT family N-acetyltransferase [Flavisolibacter sp.]|nr:GNAT family N-acetyltransferase [Flavisolibacter sp.]